MEAEDKKPSRIADKAGIRRDLFSRILAMRRPVYADELLPLPLDEGAFCREKALQQGEVGE